MTGAHEQFSSRLGFVLAAAGSAVGIGNLVAFPVAAAKNGGGAFLLVYLLFVFGLCLPLLKAELHMGRQSGKGPLGAFQSEGGRRPWWTLAGILALITPFMITVFYSVITVWLLGYLVAAAQGELSALAHPDHFGQFINSDQIGWLLLAVMGITGFILMGGVRDGIERASRILMPTLFLMLIGLVVFALTLEGAWQGVKYYLTPDVSKINFAVVSAALSQAFFSLSLGMGILITYGSYLPRDANLGQSARMIAVTDTSVAFVAGLMTLPAIFAVFPDTDTASLSDSSVGLVFSFFPKLFMAMEPLLGYGAASVIACVFFALALVAAITSLVSIIEVPVCALIDQTGQSRKGALTCILLLAGLAAWLASQSFGRTEWVSSLLTYGGGSKSLFDLLVDVFYETILPLNGLCVCLLVVYKVRFSDRRMSPSLLGSVSTLMLQTAIPLVLAAVFVNTLIAKFF